MFCPQCEEEYAWDVMICPVCDIDTVDKLAGPEPTPDVEIACVFVTGDAGVIAIAHSLLEGEKIDYFVRGDRLQNLFGIGQATSYSLAMGPVTFWVRAEDAENARGLLQDLAAPGERPLES